MKEYPYYNKYLKQGNKCTLCGQQITPQEYCVINSPEGVKVIHRSCMGNLKVAGCQAQVEVLYISDNR